MLLTIDYDFRRGEPSLYKDSPALFVGSDVLDFFILWF